ncbi:hypothetical protein QPK87_28110 [Kamptonema cortianum]|nr:hypothetical protein [Geitlerinema splendidum]MDK3160393.1 hypothetical protein [Kamptonema cortianum]
MELTDSVYDLYPPLFDEFPLESVLRDAVVRRAVPSVGKLVAEAVCQMRVAKDPRLVAGLWLYCDDLDASHDVSQRLTCETGCWWHAVMHRREGDFGNSRYWYRQAKDHPLFLGIGMDPFEIVDLAESGSDLVEPWQRTEWAMLMDWCTQNADEEKSGRHWEL